MMTVQEEMYLPDYVYEHLAISTNGTNNLVAEDITLVPKKQSKTILPLISAPLAIAIVLVLLQMIFLFLNSKAKFPTWLKYLDTFFIILLTIAGLIILFMWVATDHNSTKANYNLLWLHPLYFLLFLKKKIPQKLLISVLLLLIAVAFLCFALQLQFVHTVSKVLLVSILLFLYRQRLLINA